MDETVAAISVLEVGISQIGTVNNRLDRIRCDELRSNCVWLLTTGELAFGKNGTPHCRTLGGRVLVVGTGALVAVQVSSISLC